MITLHAQGWYHIASRGEVASFAKGSHPDPRSLLGQTVNVDGQSYLVEGVEHFAIVCPSPPWRPTCTHDFGLLLKPWSKGRVEGKKPPLTPPTVE